MRTIEWRSAARLWWQAARRPAARLGAVGVVAAAVAVLAPASPVSATRPGPAHELVAMARHHLPISVVRLGSSFAASQSSNWFGYNEGVLDTDTLFGSIGASWVSAATPPAW
jgi:hypothetical protein